MPTLLLEKIRPVYITLHTGTGASPKAFPATATETDGIRDRPSSYPFCNIPDHRSNPTPDDYNEAVEDVSPALWSRIQSVLHHSPVLVSKIRAIDLRAHHTI
jgi:hypothetical protein